MRLGVQITAFNEERLIVPAIKQFDGLKVVVGVSQKPFYSETKPDQTEKLAKSTNAKVITGTWEFERDQRNDLMLELQDCDYVLVGHADTFFTTESIQNIIHEINKPNPLRAWDIMSKMYWKNLDTVIMPDLILPTMIIGKDERFETSINIVNRPTVPCIFGVTCHHLSWAKTDAEVLKKITTYHHAPEITMEWYNNIWLNWKPGMIDIAPTNPKDYSGTTEYHLPIEIRRQIETA